MNYYATRSFNLTNNVTEHQLLKFPSSAARERFIEASEDVVTPISAVESRELMIADIWRTYSSKEADTVFHVARYIP